MEPSGQPWRPLRRAAAVAALLLPSQLPVARGWDKDGHEAIGMTTMSALSSGPVMQVKRLMHGRDAVDVAAWAHKVNEKYPWTKALHFQGQPSSRCEHRTNTWRGAGADFSSCPDNRCLIQAIKHFYGGLVHQELAEIDWHGLKLTDADRVKFLINLIGDLHQPLHFGPEAIDMGRNLTVAFRGKELSLFDFWDKELTQVTIKENPGFWWGGWTHVTRTRVEFEQDSERWKKDGVLMFERWANESANFMCEKVYGLMQHPENSQPVKIDEGLYETWKRELLSRILVAGARTAIVLNALLEHRPDGDLTAGTALHEDEEDAEDRVPKNAVGRKGEIRGSKVIHGPKAAAINFGIFVVVMAIFLQAMGIFRAKNPVTQADRAKAMDAGKSI